MKVVEGQRNESIYQGEGGESKVLNFGSGENEKTGHEVMPYFLYSKKVEFKDLLNSFESEYFPMFFGISVL
jgi:hypothetical protein